MFDPLEACHPCTLKLWHQHFSIEPPNISSNLDRKLSSDIIVASSKDCSAACWDAECWTCALLSEDSTMEDTVPSNY